MTNVLKYAQAEPGVQSGHIPGEASNGSPVSGEVGEEGHTVSTAIVFTTSATAQNVTSITVPAGDFELTAFVNFNGAGATSSSDWNSIISTNSTPSVAAGNSITGFVYHDRRPSGLDIALSHTHTPFKVSNSAPTTYYLHASATFSGGTFGCNGLLKYRRAR